MSVLALAALLAGAAPAERPRDAQVERAMAALREDGSLKVRAKAAFVLAARGAHEAVPVLRRALQEDMAAAVRMASVTALRRLGGKEAVAALREASARDRDAAVRDAAGEALDEMLHGRRTVSVEQARRAGGDDPASGRLLEVLAVQLARHGFEVVDPGQEPGFRLRASVLRLDQVESGSSYRVEVKASLVATDRAGKVAAIVEGGARARAPAASVPASRISDEALEATARSLSDDLAHRLLVPR